MSIAAQLELPLLFSWRANSNPFGWGGGKGFTCEHEGMEATVYPSQVTKIVRGETQGPRTAAQPEGHPLRVEHFWVWVIESPDTAGPVGYGHRETEFAAREAAQDCMFAKGQAA